MVPLILGLVKTGSEFLDRALVYFDFVCLQTY
jgi:hypothetical protein